VQQAFLRTFIETQNTDIQLVQARDFYSLPTLGREKNLCKSRGFLELNPGSDLLSHGNPHTIIGAEQFHF
jgi:hypothetical protein